MKKALFLKANASEEEKQQVLYEYRTEYQTFVTMDGLKKRLGIKTKLYKIIFIH